MKLHKKYQTDASMFEEKKSKKILKKSRGKWITTTLVAMSLGGVTLGAVQPIHSAFNPTTVEAQQSDDDQVLSNRTNFEGKEALLADENIQAEIQNAYTEVEPTWTANTVEDVLRAINQQAANGLSSYVIQWGDTLSVIAQALGVSVQDLVDANGIINPDLIFAGDLLAGVMSQIQSQGQVATQAPVESSVESPSTTQPVQSSQSSEPAASQPQVNVSQEEVAELESLIGEELAREFDLEAQPEAQVEADTSSTTQSSTSTTQPSSPVASEVETVSVGDHDIVLSSDDPEVLDEVSQIVQDIIADNAQMSEAEIMEEASHRYGQMMDHNPTPAEEIQEEAERTEDTTSQESVDQSEDAGEGVVEAPTSEDETTEVSQDAQPVADDTVEATEQQAPSTDDTPVTSETPAGETQEQTPTEEVISDETISRDEVTVEEQTPSADVRESETQVPEKEVVEEGTEVTQDTSVIPGDTQAVDGETTTNTLSQEPVQDSGEEIRQGLAEEPIFKEKEDELVDRPIPEERLAETPFVEGTLYTKISYGPIEIQYIDDPTLAEGTYEVVQEGSQAGAVYEYILYIDDQGNQQQVDVDEGLQSIAGETRIIAVGTGTAQPSLTEETLEHVTTIEPGVQYVQDENLPLRVEEVRQEGVPGSRTVVETRTVDENGEVVDTSTSEPTVVPAQDRVVAVGTRVETHYEQQTERETIPFEAERVGNENLPKGEERVVQDGQNGTRINYYRARFVNGEYVDRELVDSEVVQEPVSQITEYGTQVVEVKEEKVQVSIPYETTYQEATDLEAGKTQVVQPGQAGEKVDTYHVTYVNGIEEDRELVNTEVTQELVDEIIARGTLEVEERTETEVTETIPFQTVERENSSLDQGVRREVQEGRDGRVETTYQVRYENGEEVSRQEVDTNRVEPQDRIVEVGTREPQRELNTVNNISYTVEHGDTLWSIAQGFGTTTTAIARANNMPVNRILYTGMQLTIPTATLEPMDNAQSYDGRHVVMLDPGHGGTDTGATAYGTTEADLNLNLANQLESELRSRGYEVLRTRDGDETVGLTARARQANNSDADIFISLHHNAFNGSAHGVETFYYQYSPNYQPAINQANHNDEQRIANSKYLAELIQNNLVNETGANYRRLDSMSFAVLRETDIPSVLVEYGFMDNLAEFNRLTDPAYQERMTQAVANAVDRYFNDVH